MRSLQIISLILISIWPLIAHGQEKLTVEEAEIQLLLNDVQNDIDALDGTQAEKIKKANEQIRKENEFIENENERIRNMEKERANLEKEMEALEDGGPDSKS